MNRFRTKKKEREDGAGPRPSMDSQPSSGPFRMFGKGKKSQEDDKSKELDFSAALPASDDFRTSLLMTGLSARFSMLREQDDPSSKLGKASDDSVLFPKRQSRLMDFGLSHGLQDIVEVESIKNSYMGRADSANDSDDGFSRSIMDRSRPNEGNNLFGGRQKIYKLGAGAKGGAVGGRVVYDDDVAQSSFQKWRQAERDNFTSSLDREVLDEPQPDYSRRRETSSTTSSALSAGRNSTAATSVTSQFGSSVKDGQSPLPTSTSAFGHLERNVTRTRRLYEQGLNQELHDQQSSTLSRMDNLSRSRSRPARTPELTPPVPSPTASGFGERFTDRKPMMSKSSAPNLRSFSPQNAASSRTNSMEAGKRNTSQEKQPAFGGSPPLSPPISEAEDHPSLPIQPNDRGKATAMGLFTRPTQQYDDSKFAQRQVQMQQGRETPTGRSQTSDGSLRSRSSSSTQRTSSEKYEIAATLKPTEPRLSRQAGGSFFDDDDEDVTSSTGNIASSLGAHLNFSRPDDQDHPAFRKSALPTPLSFSSRDSDTSSVSDRPQTSAQQLTDEAADDSPTLGPPSGLSGMVRQHLRSTSVASSVYDTNADEHENMQPYVDSPPTKNGAAFNHWQLNENEFQSHSGTGTPNAESSPEKQPQFRSRHQSQESKREKEEEREDFARHLADGARRVREKLTSYADTDAEQPLPVPPPIPEEPAKEQTSTKSNGLGILRSKSSRTSLFDRNRDKDSSDGKSAKNAKLPGSSTSPSLQRTTDTASPSATPAENKENVHAGLKAFRQARRELQKMKELEVKQRNSTGQKPDSTPERPGAQRTISHDLAMGPPVYNARHRDHSANGLRSRATSQTPSERDRSGSETSNSGYGQVYGRRGVSQTRAEDPFDQPYGRSRSGSQLAATASTPNLNGASAAPPLPPINPRRKNGFGGLPRRSEDAVSLPSPHLTVNGGSDTGSDVENPHQNLRRITSDMGNDQRQMHVPPPPSRRPPLPHANFSSNSMPGGMF